MKEAHPAPPAWVSLCVCLSKPRGSNSEGHPNAQAPWSVQEGHCRQAPTTPLQADSHSTSSQPAGWDWGSWGVLKESCRPGQVETCATSLTPSGQGRGWRRREASHSPEATERWAMGWLRNLPMGSRASRGFCPRSSVPSSVLALGPH